MHDLPRQKLRELLIEYGRSLCDDPRRCEALLKDYCGQYKREIFVLVNALKSRVAEDLINASAGVPPALLLGRLIKRLEDELGLAENAARWAVESWALALGVPVESVVRPRPAPEPPRVEHRLKEVEPPYPACRAACALVLTPQTLHGVPRPVARWQRQPGNDRDSSGRILDGVAGKRSGAEQQRTPASGEDRAAFRYRPICRHLRRVRPLLHRDPAGETWRSRLGSRQPSGDQCQLARCGGLYRVAIGADRPKLSTTD